MSALPASSDSATQRSIGSRSEILNDDRARSNFPRWHHRCRLPTMSTPPQLETTILRSVSRSFYLSIRFLPARLREPIALAYLLARATDTVADTAKISRSVRIETLKMLSNGIQGKASREVVVDLIASFVPLQANDSERQLLESLSDCLAWLERMEQADRTEIRVVLEKITHGQMLDIHCLENPEESRALSIATKLQEDTYPFAVYFVECCTLLCCRL